MIRSNCCRALGNGQNWLSGHSSHFENEAENETAFCLILFTTVLVLARHFWLMVSALNLLSSNTEPHHFNTTQV